MRAEAQVVEIFHLLFLRFLGRAGRVDWFVLKGEPNLRYSNDIDLDFVGRQSWQAAEAVDAMRLKVATALERAAAGSGSTEGAP